MFKSREDKIKEENGVLKSRYPVFSFKDSNCVIYTRILEVMLKIKEEKFKAQKAIETIDDVLKNNKFKAERIVKEKRELKDLDMAEIKKQILKQRKIRNKIQMPIYWFLIMVVLAIFLKNKSIIILNSKILTLLIYFLPFVMVYLIVGYLGFDFIKLKMIARQYKAELSKLNSNYYAKRKALNLYYEKLDKLEYELFNVMKISYVRVDIDTMRAMYEYVVLNPNDKLSYEFYKLKDRMEFDQSVNSDVSVFVYEQELLEDKLFQKVRGNSEKENKEYHQLLVDKFSDITARVVGFEKYL